MKALNKGNVYSLNNSDGGSKQIVSFVNRNEGQENQGTNNQEVLRMLINRVKFLDSQINWTGNAEILKHLRLALVLHESRHLERLVERDLLEPEFVPTGEDGHFILENY